MRRKNYIEVAYEQASEYIDKKTSECKNLYGKYKNDNPFYEDISKKNICKIVIYMVICIVFLIMKSTVFNFLNIYLFDYINIGKIKNLISVCYSMFFIIALLYGIYRGIIIVYSFNIDKKGNSIKEIYNHLKNIQNNMKSKKEMLDFNFSKVCFTDYFTENNIEETIEEHKKKLNNIQAKYLKIFNFRNVFSCSIILIILGIGFYKFLIDTMNTKYSATSSIAILLTYFILCVAMYNAICYVIIEKYKMVVIGCFSFAQVMLGIYMKDLFTVTLKCEDLFTQGPFIVIQMFIDILVKFVLSKGGLFITIPGILIVLYIFYTDCVAEYNIKKQGIDIPYDNGAVIHITKKEINSGIISFLILSAIGTFFSALMMSKVVGKLIYFKSIIFIVVSTGILVVLRIIGLTKLDISLHERKKIMSHACFWVYLILTISMGRRFGIASLFLLFVQYLIYIFPEKLFNVLAGMWYDSY